MDSSPSPSSPSPARTTTNNSGSSNSNSNSNSSSSNNSCIATSASPPDPSSTAKSSTSPTIARNAWSQIVRGGSGSAPPPPEEQNPPPPPPPPSPPSPSQSPSASSRLPPQQQLSLSQPKLHSLTEAKNSAAEVTDAAGPPLLDLSLLASSSSSTSAGDENLSMPSASGQSTCESPGAAVQADGSDVKGSVEIKGPQSPLKIAWAKPVVEGGMSPVMGALSWPALSEARNAKPPDQSKPQLSVQKTALQTTAPSVTEDSPASSSMRSSGNGASFAPNARRHKDAPSARISSTALNTSDSTRIVPAMDMENPDRNGGRRGISHHHQRVSSNNSNKSNNNNINNINNSSSSSSNNNNNNNIAGNRRNFMRDQGRGNHGWHSHGRGYPNGRETNIAFQQQRVGPRNLPRPLYPFVNPNPAFVNAVGYQTVPGSIYYMHAPPPPPPADHFLGATYFGHPVPPMGIYMPGPDPTALQNQLVKQIEYYFSVENLCRDIYLRSNMDEQGFVPVSIIANFNRVRNIAQNVHFILDALRTSSIVEVQGDRVRKRGDWANWLIPSSQQSMGSPLERDQSAWSSSHSEATAGQEDALFRYEPRVQNGGRASLPQLQAHGIPGDETHADADSRSYGGSMNAGLTFPQSVEFNTNDDGQQGRTMSSLYKETNVVLEDKSDLQAVKVYGIE